MTKTVIEMAREAGYTPLPGFEFANELEEAFFTRFAALVREDVYKELMNMHRAENGRHNYYQYAVIQLRGEPV